MNDPTPEEIGDFLCWIGALGASRPSVIKVRDWLWDRADWDNRKYEYFRDAERWMTRDEM